MENSHTNYHSQLAWLIVYCTFILFGCSDDIDYPKLSNDTISFNILLSSKWNDVRSRSPIANSDIIDMKVVESENSNLDVPIYLHVLTSIRENVQNPFAAKNLSRGNISQSIDDFALYAFKYDDNVGIENYNFPNYINKDKVQKSNNWKSERYWPSERCGMSFFAHAPYCSNNFSVNFPLLTYKTPSSFDEQEDIFIAQTNIDFTPSDNDTQCAVSFNMEHALTAIQFDVKNFEPGMVNEILIKNIHNEGIYDFITQKWDVTSNICDFSSGIINKEVTEEAGSLVSGDIAFFMIPQEFDEHSDAIVEIKFQDNLTKSNRVVSFMLEGTWRKGEKVIYRLSTNPEMIERVLTIEYNNNIYYPNLNLYDLSESGLYDVENENQKTFNDFFVTSHEGCIKDFLLNSYAISTRVGSDDNFEIVPIEVKFDNTNEWYSIKSNPNVYGHKPENAKWGYTLTCLHQNGTAGNNIHDLNMKKNSVIGLYNLANESNHYDYEIINSDPDKVGGCNTANCYIVNGPGEYCFPLVYGNGIKDGNKNLQSYTSTATQSTGTVVFKNFYVNDGAINKGLIQNPYIPDESNKNPSDIVAKIIWMDKENLIESNVQIVQLGTSGDKYVVFKVLPENIKQGNVVIGVKGQNDDKFIWSWHIWLTDYKSHEGDIAINENYSFMPLNLGWVYGTPEHYDGRYDDFIIFQDKKSYNCKMTWQKEDKYDKSYNTLYQWGRKDPFPAGLEVDGSMNDLLAKGYKIKYTSRGSFQTNGLGFCVGRTIHYPNEFLYDSNIHNWVMNGTSGSCVLNLWNSTMNYKGDSYLNITESVVKTIYDPSPNGYRVAQACAFTNLKDLCDRGLWGYAYSLDLSMCTYFNKQNPTEFINFPLSGFRIGTSGDYSENKQINRVGQCTTTLIFDNKNIHHFCILDNGTIYSTHYDNCFAADGLSVRCVVDK